MLFSPNSRQYRFPMQCHFNVTIDTTAISKRYLSSGKTEMKTVSKFDSDI